MWIRAATVLLAMMFVALQWRLWVADSGVAQTSQLQRELDRATAELEQLRARNAAKDAEVQDLKSGGFATLESRARSSLGMIKADEQFYLVVR